jgi:hypothetical protein
MEQPNRRKFLIVAGAGAGAAAVGVAATKAGLAGPDAPPAAAAATLPATLPAGAGPLVAYVEDARSGRVSVMTGEAETVVHDPDLVARLSRAAKGRAS